MLNRDTRIPNKLGFTAKPILAVAACGNAHGIILDASSYAWAWGNNTSGELCDGTVTRRSSPVAIMYFDPAKNIFGR